MKATFENILYNLSGRVPRYGEHPIEMELRNYLNDHIHGRLTTLTYTTFENLIRDDTRRHEEYYGISKP